MCGRIQIVSRMEFRYWHLEPSSTSLTGHF